MERDIERIWRYYEFSGNLLLTANQLHQDGNSFAAFLLLYNVLEMIVKSLRESDKGTVSEDVVWLAEHKILTNQEKDFLNDENGIRKMRNIMTHRNIYSHFFEGRDGKAYSFTDYETWDLIYQEYAPNIISILANAIERNQNDSSECY